jgi:hypothetical protein
LADKADSLIEKNFANVISSTNRRTRRDYLNEGAGCFISHAREGGHPVYSALNFLDSCLRRNDGLYRRKLPDCSFREKYRFL